MGLDSLIDVTSLARLLAVPEPGGPPVLLDVRWRLGGPPGMASYRAGHLPGARFADLDRDLAGPAGAGGRHPLPEPGAFQAAMRRAGVRDGHPVVVYDESDAMAAARAWWLLRYFGHEQVRVLDGGYQAWLAAGELAETGPAETGPARRGRPRRGTAGAPQPARRAGRPRVTSPPGPEECPCWTRPGRPGSRAPGCCSTPGPRSATGVTQSRWTRSRATFPVR